MATKVCIFIDGDNPVGLYQHGKDSFKVVYGEEVHNFLTYSEAAKEYGECIMHSLQCAGLIHNS